MASNNRTVLISGAFGLAGRCTAETLLSRGQKVIGLDLETDTTKEVAEELQAREDLSGELVPAFTNLLDAEAVEALLAEQKPDAIVHLAAVVSPACYRNPEFAHKVNVGGVSNLINAACKLDKKPFFAMASSAAVFGSRNPHTQMERVTPDTPVNPIDCYGRDKVLAEEVLRASGLPHCVLRLGGVLSPDSMLTLSTDHLLLMRAIPRDNRIHAVDARDVALAFANASALDESHSGKIFLIGGNESYEMCQRELEDEIMESLGIGRLGPDAGLPGDPENDDGWSFTDWFDTTESQEVLQFQAHNWSDTSDWMKESLDKRIRDTATAFRPVLKPMVLSALAIQRKVEKRGKYADPWKLIASKYGDKILASSYD